MKFVHIADMHFDSSLSSLSEIEGLTEKIRLEQREIFRKIINYIKENKIELLFIKIFILFFSSKFISSIPEFLQ